MKYRHLRRDAVVSDCGTYRYLLHREWEPVVGSVLWVMLNPSTADADIDDPTIRKCMGFTERMGCSRMRVVNLFALRSTDPKGLKAGASIVGPMNREVLVNEFRWLHDRIIFAWGDGIKHAPVSAATEMIAFARRHCADSVCLGLTKKWKQPRHPLMLSYATEPQRWPVLDPAPAGRRTDGGEGETTGDER